MSRLFLIAVVVGISLTASGVAMARGGSGGRGSHGGHGMPHRGGQHATPARYHAPARSLHAPRVVSRSTATQARPLASHVRAAAPISRAVSRTAQPIARAGKTVAGKPIGLTTRVTATSARALSAQSTRTLQRLAATAGLNAATRVAIGAALTGRALTLRQRMLLMVAARGNGGLSAAERGELADDLAGDDEGPDGDAEEPQETESLLGMEIQDMSDGPALRQGMKVGDIILAIDGAATPDFDSLRAALEAAGPQADVIFINVDNGQTERVMLPVEDTRIGATVEQVQVN
ncbi:MAG: hypothetical protein FJ271_10790 [Planctomycetes bacterium]|nr:hypothetical protein [Planctomycetota bacterium]